MLASAPMLLVRAKYPNQGIVAIACSSTRPGRHAPVSLPGSRCAASVSQPANQQSPANHSPQSPPARPAHLLRSAVVRIPEGPAISRTPTTRRCVANLDARSVGAWSVQCCRDSADSARRPAATVGERSVSRSASGPRRVGDEHRSPPSRDISRSPSRYATCGERT